MSAPRAPTGNIAGDALRELVNVAAYPAVGHLLHRRAFRAADLDVDLRGEVHVVTGGSAGIGLGIARGLAARRATVVIVCRDAARGEAAKGEIEASTSGRVEVEIADVSSVAAVRALADRILGRHDRVRSLVNNAGVALWDRRLSADGHELTFATNVLGGFALTCLLLPALRRAAPARVVHVSSAAIYTRRLDVGELLGGEGPYRGALQYASTKRAQVELSAIFAERLAPLGITSSTMHPGLTATPGTRRSTPLYHRLFSRVLRDEDQGADTAVWLAASPVAAGRTGELWFDREVRPAHVVPWTRAPRAEAENLFAVCAELSDIDPRTLERSRLGGAR